MTNQRRIAALLLCIGLVFALAVSSAYTVHEAGHDCSGHDCPVCQLIIGNMNLLRALGLAILVLLALFALLQEKFVQQAQQQLCLPASGTLVNWKIRLND